MPLCNTVNTNCHHRTDQHEQRTCSHHNLTEQNRPCMQGRWNKTNTIPPQVTAPPWQQPSALAAACQQQHLALPLPCCMYCCDHLTVVHCAGSHPWLQPVLYHPDLCRKNKFWRILDSRSKQQHTSVMLCVGSAHALSSRGYLPASHAQAVSTSSGMST
jgi:hypothetical protein